MGAFGRCITHSGDELDGAKDGLDEAIWLNISKLPAEVHMIIFVVAAYKGGHLCDASNGKIHILEERNDNEVACFSMENSKAEVDAVAVMERKAGTWALQ